MTESIVVASHLTKQYESKKRWTTWMSSFRRDAL